MRKDGSTEMRSASVELEDSMAELELDGECVSVSVS